MIKKEEGEYMKKLVSRIASSLLVVFLLVFSGNVLAEPGYVNEASIKTDKVFEDLKKLQKDVFTLESIVNSQIYYYKKNQYLSYEIDKSTEDCLDKIGDFADRYLNNENISNIDNLKLRKIADLFDLSCQSLNNLSKGTNNQSNVGSKIFTFNANISFEIKRRKAS